MRLPRRIRQIIRKGAFAVVPPLPVPPSYSQAGEDAILRFLFMDKKVQRISYLDVGTNIPDYSNNTYLFYLNGSSGVCVEADPTLIPSITAVRPRDRVLNVGVVAAAGSGESGWADLFVFDAKGLNTFDKEEADKRAASGKYKVTEVARVKLMSINAILRENFSHTPDLLSLDIEGLDRQVLETLDFERFPIPVICVETCLYSENHVRPKDPSIASLLLSKGYEVYADTYINTIFVNKPWFYAA
jgi:FkbM family methyltransferase